jgi:hypothetical protein
METKKNEGGAGAIVILYAVFLTLGVLTMSFAVYDRYDRKKKEKNKAGQSNTEGGK